MSEFLATNTRVMTLGAKGRDPELMTVITSEAPPAEPATRGVYSFKRA